MIRLNDDLPACQASLDESTLSPRAAVVRLPIRDRDAARRRRAERRTWLWLTLLMLLTTVGGLWGAWDRQPMGEARTERQQEVERG